MSRFASAPGGIAPGSLGAWWLAARPRTLSLAVAPVLLGSSLAWAETGAFDASVLIVALLAAVFIQVGTNLYNDAGDFLRGADTPRRLGPPRATACGWLTSQQVRRAAALSFAVALGLGAYLVWVGGIAILVLGMLCMAAGFAYTGGPRPIAYTALGELFVWLFFGLAAVVGTYFLQSGTVSWAAGAAGAMMGWLAAAVLVVNNYRDMDEDRVNGKRTMVVHLGRRGARFEYGLFLLLPFAALPAIPALGAAGWTALAGWAAAPWALAILRRFLHTPAGPALNGVLSDTARLQLAFAALVCVGLLVPLP